MSINFYRKPPQPGRARRLVLAGLALAALGLLGLALFQYTRGAAAAPAATGTPAALVAPTTAARATTALVVATSRDSAAATIATAAPAATFNLPIVALPPTSNGPHAALTSPAIEVVNGLSVELRDAQHDGDMLQVDMCHQVPASLPNLELGHRPSDVTVQAQGQTFSFTSVSLTGWQTAPTGDAIGRCDQVSFSVPATLDLSQFSVTVRRLMTPTSESPDCGAVQDKLDRAGSGIIIACHPGDYSFNWEVITRPPTLTVDAANQIARDAFSDIVNGPWVFTASLSGAALPSPDPVATAAPRAAHPATVSFMRTNDLTGAISEIVLPLDCLSQPGGCDLASALTVPLPPTNALSGAAWSPAGEAFAFLAGVDGRFDVYRANADGSGLVDLTPSAGIRNAVSWSPDGQYLLWEQAGGVTDELWLMNPDGSQPHKLVDGAQPAWSPDGRQLVCTVQSADSSNALGVRADLYELTLAAPGASPGASPQRLTDLPNLINSPSFSPNGRQLAFTAESLDMTTWGIYILSLDDATLPLSSLDAPGVRRLTPNGMLGDAPVWSPDGAWLAYSANAAGIVFPAIYVSAADGSSTVQVSAVNRFPDLSPAWSPDGQRLAYVANDGGHSNISLVNPDGTGLLSLTASAGSSDNSTRTVEFEEPSWRP